MARQRPDRAETEIICKANRIQSAQRKRDGIHSHKLRYYTRAGPLPYSALQRIEFFALSDDLRQRALRSDLSEIAKMVQQFYFLESADI